MTPVRTCQLDLVRAMPDQAVCPSLKRPIVAPNREWITCGTTIVAVRDIAFFSTTEHDRICVTLRDYSMHRTRPLTPAERSNVLRLLYGMPP